MIEKHVSFKPIGFLHFLSEERVARIQEYRDRTMLLATENKWEPSKGPEGSKGPAKAFTSVWHLRRELHAAGLNPFSSIS